MVLITTPVRSSVCYCISSIYPMGTLLLGGRGCLSPARGSLSRWIVVAPGPAPFYGPFGLLPPCGFRLVCVGPLIPPCCGMLSLVVLVFFGPIPAISIVSSGLFGPRRCAWVAGTCVFRFDSDLVGSFHCWARSFWCTRSCYFCHRYRFRFRSALARIVAHSMDRNRRSPTESLTDPV